MVGLLTRTVVGGLDRLDRRPTASDARRTRAVLDRKVERLAETMGVDAARRELELLALFEVPRLLASTVDLPRRRALALLMHVARTKRTVMARMLHRGRPPPIVFPDRPGKRE